MDVVRWGIIGCGDVTEGVPQGGGSALVAVMRRNRAAAEDHARRHGVPRVHTTATALIQDPEVDAVYVATPPSSHPELALRVAAARKPCIVEKPMARTHAECVAMNEAFRAAGVPLFVAYYRRALPRFLEVRRLLLAGEIGPVTDVHVRVSFRNPPHVHQPLIQTMVDELLGRGRCESTGESGARTAWVMDRCVEGDYRSR